MLPYKLKDIFIVCPAIVDTTNFHANSELLFLLLLWKRRMLAHE
jgi:hypothetical protein